MKDSILRTLVPIVYALLLKWGFGDWLGLDDEFIQSLAALLAAGIVYVILRLLEQYQPLFGLLLGSKKQPVYVKPAAVEDVKAHVPAIEGKHAA